ncbi:hypothetical protein VTI74DRAFT_10666 [Chaetomium olivicolor]
MPQWICKPSRLECQLHVEPNRRPIGVRRCLWLEPTNCRGSNVDVQVWHRRDKPRACQARLGASLVRRRGSRTMSEREWHKAAAETLLSIARDIFSGVSFGALWSRSLNLALGSHCMVPGNRKPPPRPPHHGKSSARLKGHLPGDPQHNQIIPFVV